MASIHTSATLHSQSFRRIYTTTTTCQASNARTGISSSSDRRRFILMTSGVAATFAAGQMTAKAEDIGFFGVRKKVKQVEKEAEATVDKGAEKGTQAGAKGTETESSASFGAVVQAGALAGAEFLGVVAATFFVNRILESEA